MPSRLIRCPTGRTLTAAFDLAPRERGGHVTAELGFGIGTLTILGLVLDAVVRKLVGPRLAAHRSRMREKRENLKRLLKAGTAAPSRA